MALQYRWNDNCDTVIGESLTVAGSQEVIGRVRRVVTADDSESYLAHDGWREDTEEWYVPKHAFHRVYPTQAAARAGLIQWAENFRLTRAAVDAVNAATDPVALLAAAADAVKKHFRIYLATLHNLANRAAGCCDHDLSADARQQCRQIEDDLYTLVGFEIANEYRRWQDRRGSGECWWARDETAA